MALNDNSLKGVPVFRCGKTTLCQLLMKILNKTLYIINCHMHTEAADFLGGLRPIRNRTEDTEVVQNGIEDTVEVSNILIFHFYYYYYYFFFFFYRWRVIHWRYLNGVMGYSLRV